MRNHEATKAHALLDARGNLAGRGDCCKSRTAGKFGRMSGRAILDDGTPIEIRDVLCFAEKGHDRY